VIEPSGESVLIDVDRKCSSVAALMCKAGAESLDRVTEQDEETGLGGGLSEEGGDPRVLDVVGSPLTRKVAVGSREPTVIERAFGGTERADGVPPEEVAFLVDVASAVDVRVGTDGVVPPRRACLLGTDTYKVRRSRTLMLLGRWRYWIEAVFPRRVLA
jgi:hypothetical protein